MRTERLDIRQISDDKYDICLLTDETKIGGISLAHTGGDHELSYEIGEEYGYQRYATEAVCAFAPYAANELGFDKLYYSVSADNIPAYRTMQTAGFTYLCSAKGAPRSERFAYVKDTGAINVFDAGIDGVKIIDYPRKPESRGSSYQVFNRDKLISEGIQFDYSEETVYCPKKKHTIYGVHFQNKPMDQAKLLYCLKGRGYDFAVDLRRNSPTFTKWIRVELTAENRRQIFIPRGFGHLFCSLEDDTEVVMRYDRPFIEEYRRGIAWDDAKIALDLPTIHPVLAKHDINAPTIDESDLNL